MAEVPRRWNGSADGEVVVLTPPDRWAPDVVRRGEELLLVVVVPEGQADYVYEFPIDERLLAVLSADRERYFLLFALLRARYAGAFAGESLESRLTRLDGRELGALYDIVLFGPRDQVEALATQQDRASLGEVSATICLHTGANLAELRAGRWFGSGILEDPRDRI